MTWLLPGVFVQHRTFPSQKASDPLATRRHYAHAERKLAAHRKSLYGKLVHERVRVGNRIQMEKTSYQGWQKRYAKSVGLRAPGMFVAHLARTVAKTGGTLHEVSTFKTKLSQYCHGCGTYLKKPLSQRWHQCPCGIGPVQRDLYSAFLLASLPRTRTHPLHLPPRVGRCGDAPASRDGAITTTCE
jgi:transposase